VIARPEDPAERGAGVRFVAERVGAIVAAGDG
jgi:hypothetical protein